MTSIAELENLAIAFSQRGDIPSTIRTCQEILAVDGNHLSSLRFLADIAIDSGDLSSAANYLKTLLANSPGDLQALSQLGQALYRRGELEQAVDVYTDYWRIKPGGSTIYLTLGCLYAELGDIDKAAQVFSLGEAVNADLLSLWKNPDTNPGVSKMSKTAWETLCQHHTELHVAAVDADGRQEDLDRIRDAVWPLADMRPVNYRHPKHRPQGFSIKYDTAPTFFDSNMFPWREHLELRYPDIRREILAGLDVATDGKPYLSDRHRLEGQLWEPLVNKMSWASVHLYQNGVANEKVIHKFPETLEALGGVPVATTDGNPSEVFISVLAPHTRIPEHFGVSSAILTAHLPIEVPPGCGLEVHGETRAPEPGKLMVFDDTWEHCAWNDSDQPRVVLIFELWHPELSEPERLAISRSFQARRDWVRRRKVD
ncbi:MAG: aspartyl/asparaginyl beta-hydroxylase domain-containing protein [Halieaceae bacterium]|jgi:tetratricopeptide (TPR) repeat protein|nr:aspartyl/asparaginyl beta-hydroxylase domain-containing protein [Halieaceae bacterium]